MKKDSTVCWYCGEATLQPCPELDSGWLKCPKCGATWVKMLNPKELEVTLDRRSLDVYQLGRRQIRKEKRARKA